MPCLPLWLQSFKCQRMRVWPGGRAPGPALLGLSPQLHGKVIQTLLNNNCYGCNSCNSCTVLAHTGVASAMHGADWHGRRLRCGPGRGNPRALRLRMTRWRGMVASITSTEFPDVQSVCANYHCQHHEQCGSSCCFLCTCRLRSDLHAACTAIEEFPDLMKLHAQQVHVQVLSLPAGSILYRGSAAQLSQAELNFAS